MIIASSVSLSTLAKRASQAMAVPLARGAPKVGALGDAVDVDKLTRRAFLWCPATALQCLTRDTAIACALRLAAKHHRNAESVIITLKEH